MKYLFFSVFFLTITLQAQSVTSVSTETKQSELSESEFEQAKKLYLVMLNSPNWKAIDSIATTIAHNTGRSKHPPIGDSLYIPWVKENLHLTKFKSADEAQSLLDMQKKISTELEKENLPLYKLMGKASRNQLDIIMRPMMNNANRHFLEE